MPIDESEWESLEKAPMPQSEVLDFLNDDPGHAYEYEEVVESLSFNNEESEQRYEEALGYLIERGDVPVRSTAEVETLYVRSPEAED